MGIISTDLKAYYSEDRTDRIRTIGGPPVLHNPVTPDFKDQKIETEATKTCNTSFLSLKRPDFKYVIFKIVEVS